MALLVFIFLLFTLLITLLALHDQPRIFLQLFTGIGVLLQESAQVGMLAQVGRVIDQVRILAQVGTHVLMLIEVSVPISQLAPGDVVLLGSAAPIFILLIGAFTLHKGSRV